MATIEDKEIVSGLERARAVRARTLEMLEGLSQEQMNRRPTHGSWLDGEKGKWSLGEHADHILRVEDHMRTEIIGKLIEMSASNSRPYLRKTLAEIRLISTLIPRPLQGPAEVFFQLSNKVSRFVVPRWVVEQLFRHTRFPATTPEPWQPRAGRPRDELLAELTTSLDLMDEMFGKVPGADYQHMVFEHTVVGRHTVPQLLRIISIHEEWHQDRITELLKA